MDRFSSTASARAAQLGIAAFVALALALHLCPQPQLTAVTGQRFAYDPRINFMSEYVRTQYSPLMTAGFFLLALIGGLLAHAVRHRHHTPLLGTTGVGLAALGLCPTDLAFHREAHSLLGRIHNPLSTLVFVPLVALIAGVLWQTRDEPAWRGFRCWSAFCGALAVVGIGSGLVYLGAIHWQENYWTGWMQRSLLLPTLLWLSGLARQCTR